jgi:scyllo-inositol 2-dehydrogenase (NADP+)
VKNQRPIAVGLIGYGKAGQVFHAPLIESVQGLRLAAIVERTGEDARRRYPQATIVRDAAELFDDASIDLVVVATPNDSHFDLARRALLAGKDVVVDKPFTVTSAEADDLIELAKQSGRLLTVFHNRRYEGDFVTIRSLIDRGAFGRLVSYEARFDRFRNEPRPAAWRKTSRPGSGILYDLGSHLIDQALLLFGPPESVNADVRRERDFGESDDAFDVSLEYPALRVRLTASMLVREPTPRYTLRGTAATFVKFGSDPQEAALAAGGSPRDSNWGREPREQWGTLIRDNGSETIETRPGSYATFYENVRDAINGKAPLDVRPEDAAMTIRIIEAAID